MLLSNVRRHPIEPQHNVVTKLGQLVVVATALQLDKALRCRLQMLRERVKERRVNNEFLILVHLGSHPTTQLGLAHCRRRLIELYRRSKRL
ncbi:MAG: hypothetical protein HKN84_10225 [Gammaproteobacteria bacterium]|nr:hypothetical protein [Gammaproteobacteria bacterium]